MGYKEWEYKHGKFMRNSPPILGITVCRENIPHGEIAEILNSQSSEIADLKRKLEDSQSSHLTHHKVLRRVTKANGDFADHLEISKALNDAQMADRLKMESEIAGLRETVERLTDRDSRVSSILTKEQIKQLADEADSRKDVIDVAHFLSESIARTESHRFYLILVDVLKFSENPTLEPGLPTELVERIKALNLQIPNPSEIPNSSEFIVTEADQREADKAIADGSAKLQMPVTGHGITEVSDAAEG